MIKVLNIIKENNRIKYYECISDNNKTANLTKEQLINYINTKQVVNATVQNYKGQVIIRVKEASKTDTTKHSTFNPSTLLKNINEAIIIGKSIGLDLKESIHNALELESTTKEQCFQLAEYLSKITMHSSIRALILYELSIKAGYKNIELKYNEDTEEYSTRYDQETDYCGDLKAAGEVSIFITNMRKMFREYYAEFLDLSFFNTSNVTNMVCMFEHCYVKYVDLSTFNTSNVTNMGGMFENCQVQSLDLSTFNTSNVTNMTCMFKYCYAQSIDLSSFNTFNVTNMGGMFYDCKAQSLDLSNFNTSNVKDMSFMFSDCKANPIYISKNCQENLKETLTKANIPIAYK